ncbi:P-loop containing nucleoside triphosphate hydrolase protein [Auricularia subglabra TFB-10046 SS5]|nr:P-loop containing nucleoside triphosphate hydrolase protein [Auricularia subglabra TFB-10046 SS5]
MSGAPVVVDRTTYREPVPLIVFDDPAAGLDDILLRTGPLPSSRGILREAPHISLATRGPLTYRDAMAYDCVQLANFPARPWQLDAAEILKSGRDVLVQAMTGAGKSLPFVLPVLTNPSDFVIIASPLNILESGMAAAYAKLGLKCLIYNAENRSREQAVALRNRAFHVLLTAPENLTHQGALRPLLADPDWSSACALLGIDEAHLIIDWGLQNFRPEYAKLGQLRSYFDAPILAVSATLPPAAVSSLTKLLHLSDEYNFINLGNARDNIFWEIREIGGAVLGLKSLRFLVPATVTDPHVIPQTIVFVQSRPLAHRVASKIRSFFPEALRHEEIVMPLHAFMRPPHKERVIAQFEAGETRIMVCTSIAALGRDFSSVTRIVAFHLPELSVQAQSWCYGMRRH